MIVSLICLTNGLASCSCIVSVILAVYPRAHRYRDAEEHSNAVELVIKDESFHLPLEP